MSNSKVLDRSEQRVGWWRCYRDTGCRYHPLCLECPEEKCLQEEGSPRNTGRDSLIKLMQAAGLKQREIAAHYGLTRRSVTRILSRC